MATTRIPKNYTKKVYKSVHNRSCIRRTTLHPGLGIPIYSRRVMAGEKVYIDPTTVLQTNAMLAPLMGSFRLQLAVFFDSDSNYYGWMDNNRRMSTEELLNRQRHYDDLYTMLGESALKQEDELPLDSWLQTDTGVKKHSLLEYMGIPVRAIATGPSSDVELGPKFDMGFVLTYYNIFRNYYANNQESSFPYVSNNFDTSSEPFNTIPLSELDDFFMWLRYQKNGVDLSLSSDSNDSRAYKIIRQSFNKPFGGLWLCTYQPDLLTNLLQTGAGTKSYVRVTTDGDEANTFTIDTLRFQNKLQRLIDRLDVSGGRFSNWLRAVWGVKTRKDMDIPELIGVTQKLIDPTDLTTKSNSAEISISDTEKVDPRFTGDLASNFNKVHGHRGHSFYASTPGRVMIIATLVPNVDYCQGFDYEVTKVNFADDYVPEFSQLGFQSVSQSRYSALPKFDPNFVFENYLTNSVGRQVAWLEEMTDVNRNFGEFSWDGIYNYWVLNRLFSKVRNEVSGKSFETHITQYVNPLDWQYPFIAQKFTDPNWFLQVGLRIKCIRPIGKRFMPNLE